MKVEFLPIEVRQYQARVAQGKAGDQILQKVTQLSQIFDQPMNSVVVLDGSQRTPKSLDGVADVPLSSPQIVPQPDAQPPATIIPEPAPEQPDSEALSSGDPGETAPGFQVRSSSGSQILLGDPGIDAAPKPDDLASQKPKPPQPISEEEALKPYIQEPFIVDPFIPLPSNRKPVSPTSQGYNQSSAPISFTVSLSRFKSQPERHGPAEKVLSLSSASLKSGSRIELPVLNG